MRWLHRSYRFLGLLAIATVLLATSAARADVTRFDLSGTVTDSTGGVLPGVTITIKNGDTGQTRTTVTDERGRYSFTALESTGSWTLAAELQGFQTQVRQGLRFQANTRPEVNVQMGVATIQEALTVKAEAPLVETRASEIGRTLNDRQVSDLPTNGRNFLSLLQLSGSVVPVGGGSGNISINGQGTRMANFLADGVSMTGREIRTLNGEFGGGNGLSLDVIQELQVISNGFKAEIGNTGAGTISVVTKSGTNQLRGSAYTYQRPNDLVADDVLTKQSTKQTRRQYGGTVGGPIAKDRTHFFFNYEATRIHDVAIVTSALAPGQFPAPQQQDQFFSKINHRLGDHNNLDARFNFNINTQEGQSAGALNTYDRRSNTESSTYNVVTSLVTTLGSTTTNEARFRYTYDAVDFFSPLVSKTGKESRTPNFAGVPPAYTYAGVGNAGPSNIFPQNLIEKRAEWVDHFTIVRGAHTMKVGGDLLASWRFVTFFNNINGQYTFAPGTPRPFDINTRATYPVQFTQSFGGSGLNFRDALLSGFAQDDWEITPGLVFNLGVRYDKDTLFQGDNNNVAPRLGAVWNVGNRGRTIVRGNFGIFYDTLESSLINRESNFGPKGQASIDLRCSTQQCDPLFPTFPANFSAFPTGANAPFRATVYVPVFKGDRFPFSIGDHFKRVAPYFMNGSIGVQQQIRQDWAVTADYTRVEGKNLLVTLDINAPPFFAVGPGQTRSLGAGDAQRPLGFPNSTGGPFAVAFSGFRDLFLQANGGHTLYNAIKFGLTKRYSHRYLLQANYTYSQATGNVDGFRLSGSFVPGLRDPKGDRGYQQGRLDTDTPHVFVLNGLVEVWGGLRVGSILFVRSGLPYTGVTGTDSDGDGVTAGGSYSDRPSSLKRNSFRRPPLASLDLSLAKVVRIAGSQTVEVRADIFNLTNRLNVNAVNNVIGLDPANPPAAFGRTTSAREQRQAQIAIRYSF